MSAEQNSGCETSGEDGTSADRIPDVRYPGWKMAAERDSGCETPGWKMAAENDSGG